MISVRYFCLIKRFSMQFCKVYQKYQIYMYLLFSFIHVFIHNSITKYYWQTFVKSLARAFWKPLLKIPNVKLVSWKLLSNTCDYVTRKHLIGTDTGNVFFFSFLELWPNGKHWCPWLNCWRKSIMIFKTLCVPKMLAPTEMEF